jgi:hypothetical protein
VPDVDARILRLEQATVTVLLLAGFVFSIVWTIPVAAALTGLDAALGRSGPTPVFWRAVLAPRLGPPRAVDTAAGARAQQLCVFAVLVVATLFALASLGLIATILAILVAAVSASCATGLFNLGAELDKRNQPRRRGGGRGPRPRS